MPQPNLSNWYHHNLDPIALQWGATVIPWYWLVYVLGWFWSAFIFRKTFLTTLAAFDVTENKNTPHPLIHRFHVAQSEFLFWGWISLIFGARLTYILFYNLNYYIEHPDQVFALWNGGMSFHGGFLGVTLAAVLIARHRKISFFMLTDPLALAIPWVLAVGRLANFANGELVGRISTVPWAVVFPAPFDGAPRHPSQLYESIFEGVFVGTILFLKRNIYGKKPGCLSFAFMGLYACTRFFVEFTREPDAQIGFLAGLTMGQWLCLGMIVWAILGISKLETRSQT